MKFLQLTNGNVVEATIQPKNEWIDKAANRSFAGEGFIQVNDNIDEPSLLGHKYDASAESETIKTESSFTAPGVDASGKARWFDAETGILTQNTYENGVITGSEAV